MKEAIHDVFGQPFEVSAPGFEHCLQSLGTVNLAQELGAFLAVGGV